MPVPKVLAKKFVIIADRHGTDYNGETTKTGLMKYALYEFVKQYETKYKTAITDEELAAMTEEQFQASR